MEKKGRETQLGSFSSEVEAAKAYDRAARVHHGRDALCNFPAPLPATTSSRRRSAEEAALVALVVEKGKVLAVPVPVEAPPAPAIPAEAPPEETLLPAMGGAVAEGGKGPAADAPTTEAGAAMQVDAPAAEGGAAASGQASGPQGKGEGASKKASSKYRGTDTLPLITAGGEGGEDDLLGLRVGVFRRVVHEVDGQVAREPVHQAGRAVPGHVRRRGRGGAHLRPRRAQALRQPRAPQLPRLARGLQGRQPQALQEAQEEGRQAPAAGGGLAVGAVLRPRPPREEEAQARARVVRLLIQGQGAQEGGWRQAHALQVRLHRVSGHR
jgi:hypothetical protein